MTNLPDMNVHGFAATGCGQRPRQPHGLQVDEMAAITLYTMESELYPTLNRLLRQRDRQGLKPFFPFLKLMLLARDRLPKHSGIVWRGVPGVDLRASYPKNKARLLLECSNAHRFPYASLLPPLLA